MIKAHFSGKLVSNGISDVVLGLVYSEKTCLMIIIIIIIVIIIMNKLQETMVLMGDNYHYHQQLFQTGFLRVY